MSHVHCPACRYAYSTLASTGCPRCAPARSAAPAIAVDPLDEVDVALDRLAVALGRLAPDELEAVAMRLVSTEHSDTWAGVIAGAIAGAVLAGRHASGPELVVATELSPEPPRHAPPTDRERALLTLALALIARLAAMTRDAAARFRRR